MPKIRRILIAVRDLHRVPRAQLAKAAALARATHASLELLHVANDPLLAEPVRLQDRAGFGRAAAAALAERTERRLRALARSRLFAGLKVNYELSRDYPPAEAIVRRVVRSRADLLIAASGRHGRTSRWFLANTDWELLRRCPCPVLFVKSTRTWRRPVVLAAVDPFHEHAKPARLEGRLLDVAGGIAKVLRGELHAIHAYLPLALSALAPLEQMPAYVPPEAEQANTAAVTRAFHRLARRAAIPHSRQHLRMGDVPSALIAVTRRLGAGIVAMGAVSRSNLRRLFIGSTAERVIDELRCDVLVVKPPGFRA